MTGLKFPNAEKCLLSTSDFSSYLRGYGLTEGNLFEALDGYAWFQSLMILFNCPPDQEFAKKRTREELLTSLPKFQADMKNNEEFIVQARDCMLEQTLLVPDEWDKEFGSVS